MRAVPDCRADAKITIVVPHPRHDDFLHDPTHVRAITPESFQLYSQANNRRWQQMGASNTPLGLYLGIDFDVTATQLRLDDPWRGQFEKGEITQQEVQLYVRTLSNVVKECVITLRAVKPGRG